MKKISIVLLSLMIIILLAGCNNNYATNNTSKRCYYKDFIKIYEGLYYDPTTNNVYMWNGSGAFSYSATVPSPYYTADGEIYKYNPETKELEEPKKEEDTNDN